MGFFKLKQEHYVMIVKSALKIQKQTEKSET